MTIEHNVITDPEIHEPKGISTADPHTVYTADGLSSGDWSYTDNPWALMTRSGTSPSHSLTDVSATYQNVFANTFGSFEISIGWRIERMDDTFPANPSFTILEEGAYLFTFQTNFEPISADRYYFKIIEAVSANPSLGTVAGSGEESIASLTLDAGTASGAIYPISITRILRMGATERITIAVGSDNTNTGSSVFHQTYCTLSKLSPNLSTPF